MAFAKLEYSRKKVQKAGDTLRELPANAKQIENAMPVISNWRAAHAYPLNTFQATLRTRLQGLGLGPDKAPVGQRLKRLPSIAKKLQRFKDMDLQRMQDIAGLRAVVPTISHLNKLTNSYVHGSRFAHELRNIHDYVAHPKDDGYRSIHLIYRYQNERVADYNGLHVELQLRTRLQHAWATAVETVDIFANQAIKAGHTTPQWSSFFALASAAFALTEKCAVPANYAGRTIDEVVDQLIEAERALNVLMRLRGFSVAADRIQRIGRSSAAYHLVILNTADRTLSIKSFAGDALANATAAYSEAELRTATGHPIDAVLVAGGGVDQLRKTYPNYFLDASFFVQRLESICKSRALLTPPHEARKITKKVT